MPDLSELHAFRRQQVEERERQAVFQVRAQAAAGQRAETLLLSDIWHVWEEHVRVMLQHDEDEAQVVRLALECPEVVGLDVERSRNRLFFLLGRIEARRQDLDLPPELERRGREAQKPLDKQPGA